MAAALDLIFTPRTVTGPTFHPFPRLPRQLRERIWELSIEPREVTVRRQRPLGYFSSPTPVPPTLQTCRESRLFLERFYTKAFLYFGYPQYTWANFDIDTVHTQDYNVDWFTAENPYIRRLILDASDTEFLWRKYLTPIVTLPLLESVIFRTGEELDEGWVDWVDIMESITRDFEYFRDKMPNPTYPFVRIIDSVGYEMNSGNWRRLNREKRKALAVLHPDMWETISDSDSDSS